MEDVKLVSIEWLDSRQPSSEWRHLTNFKSAGICHCVSVGYLIYDGEDCKVIAPSMADIESEEDMQVSGVIHIPTCSVTKITPLIESEDF